MATDHKLINHCYYKVFARVKYLQLLSTTDDGARVLDRTFWNFSCYSRKLYDTRKVSKPNKTKRLIDTIAFYYGYRQKMAQ